MLIILSYILTVFIILFCGNKGAKSIGTAIINVLLMLVAIFMIYRGVNPFIVTLTLSLIFAYVILFYQNETDERSKTAFISVISVIIIILPMVYLLAANSSCQGFDKTQYEITDSNGYSRNIDINMLSLQVSVMIIALIGAVTDTAMAVASSIYEISSVKPQLSKTDLLKSGLIVGKSILSTSIHTVFYIYLAEYSTLIMQYVNSYSMAEMLNSKSFAQGMISIAVSGTGCSLVVPITAILSVVRLKKD